MPRDVGEWTREKLAVPSQYLPLYLQATTKALERIYIDGFAGPGRNRIKGTGELIDGSPLIALKARAKKGTAFDRLFFIERDHATASELRQLLDQPASARRTRVIEGDINVELPRLIQQLPRRSPTFVFLDTQGIEPRWETIKAVSPWRTELLVNFPFGMAINRNRDSNKVTEYFGSTEWRGILESPEPGRLKKLLDFYKSRLRDLGYEYSMERDPLITAKGGQRLYYLVFVSKVKPGKRIMEWVQNQPDARGQAQWRM